MVAPDTLDQQVNFCGHFFVIAAPKMIPQDLKNGLERRVWQFYTICDKNRLLKIKIGIDMAILVPRWLDFSWQVRRSAIGRVLG